MQTPHSEESQGRHETERFIVGRTVGTGQPCIIRDRDSVFAIFPSEPNGHSQAQAVCNMLNSADNALKIL